MNNHPRQPQTISDSQHSHHSEQLAQALFGAIGKAEIYYNRAHAEHGMGGYYDKE